MNYFSDLSLWWIIPIAVLSVGLSYLYYYRSQQKDQWDNKQRKILVSLRTISLFLLLFLLLGLVWETIDYRKEKPLFITLIDQSSSMDNYKDSSKVKQQISDFREAFTERFGDRFELVEWGIGENARPFKDLKFNDKQTNLATGFEQIRELYFNRNIGGITLISDGNFNEGVHPMYEAERIELTPVFGLGVGDTATRRDVLIRSVNSNEVAFLNNQFPIEATVDFNKMNRGPAKVSLLQQGKVIQTQTVNCTNTIFDQQAVTFNVTAKQKGFQRFTVQVEYKIGEFSKENNQQSCYVEVVDNKNLIVCLSSAPHPDIAAIRSILEEDEQSTVKADLTQSYNAGKERPDLVVWYENGSKPNATLFNELKQKKIPVLLIVGPTTSPQVIQSYNFGLRVSGNSQQEDAYPAVSKGFSAFEFTSTFTNASSFYPPLRTKFGTPNLPANAIVVLQQRVGDIVKNDPLMYLSTQQDVRMGVILGEGIWRWKMKEYASKKNTDGFREFIQKITQYLTVKQQKDPLRITLPKRFNVTDNIEIKAEFYNEAMELITTPSITFSYTKKGGGKQQSDFAPFTNFYKTTIGQLEPGTYSWTAIANNKGKVHKKSGEFIIEDIAIESMDTRADFGVLNQLAQQSDGKFETLENYKRLLDVIAARKDISTMQFADSGYTSLIEWIWIFVVIILLFGTEWFLRRWWGGY